MCLAMPSSGADGTVTVNLVLVAVGSAFVGAIGRVVATRLGAHRIAATVLSRVVKQESADRQVLSELERDPFWSRDYARPSDPRTGKALT